MFKIISAVFSTGFAVGAASALLAIHRGHIEVTGNQPDHADDTEVDDNEVNDNEVNDTVRNGSGQAPGPEDSVAIDAGLADS